MKISINVSGRVLTAVVAGNATAWNFVSLLPLVVDGGQTIQ